MLSNKFTSFSPEAFCHFSSVCVHTYTTLIIICLHINFFHFTYSIL